MTARCFVDTNLLVYADDRRDPVKQRRAQAVVLGLLREGTGVVSTQVLVEYYAAATRKLGIAAAVARRKVELLSRFDVVQLTAKDVLEAIDLERLNALSIWDALILQAARVAGCELLYTEDMQDGQQLAGVRISNPLLSG